MASHKQGNKKQEFLNTWATDDTDTCFPYVAHKSKNAKSSQLCEKVQQVLNNAVHDGQLQEGVANRADHADWVVKLFSTWYKA